MKTLVETTRLSLREFTPDDYDALCLMLRDAETMCAYEHAFSEAESHAWLQNQLNRYEKYGFGLWAVILKESGELIGQCGLTMQDAAEFGEVVEVGLHLPQGSLAQGLCLGGRRRLQGLCL